MFTNRIRLPFQLGKPQFPEEKTVYRKIDGSTQTLSVVVKKTYAGETDYLPERWHQRLVIALAHDNVSIEGDRYLGGVSKDGDYEINWPDFLDYPTAKAAFTVNVTPFDATNSNCMTCEEASQLSLEDDQFPGTLQEDSTYTLQVEANDAICCYPAVFSITSFDAAYLSSASLDQTGLLTIHTKTGLTSANGLKLLTYRVTCASGGFDEADVLANLEGGPPVCLAPSAPVLTAVSTTTADISFTASVSTPDHYLWRLYKASAPGVLVQSGTSTTVLNLTGLEQSTQYIWYVRSQCGAGDDDATASNFINLPFTTNPETNLCGQYYFTYTDPSRPPTAYTRGTYLDCNGNYQTEYINNFQTKYFCALQTSAGAPVSINPGLAFIGHGTDSNC